MSIPRVAKHKEECGGTGHLQHIENKAGEKPRGVYRCYTCGKLFYGD